TSPACCAWTTSRPGGPAASPRTRRSGAGAVLPDYDTRPDFYYDEQRTCVYVDGPVHNYPERHARDAEVTARLQDGGYEVIRVAGSETWDEAIRTNTWVLGPGRAD